GRTFFNYYRPTADGRVLWGTSEATYYRGNLVSASCDHSARHYQSLTDSWKRHFPAGRPGVGVRLGRSDLLHDPDDALLRISRPRSGALRTGIYRARTGNHPAGWTDSRAHGAGPSD